MAREGAGEPADAAARRAAPSVVVYPPGRLPDPGLARAQAALAGATRTRRLDVPPRDARAIRVPAGSILRILCPEGPQVGDLNLFAERDLSERFFSGKTRALHGTHVTVGDRLWSSLPHLRPMATVIGDSLAWYGTDADGLRVHDVIGTRCDPYTQRLLGGVDYDRCCHSNLTRALVAATGLAPEDAEPLVHDVLNVFMCTGFDAAGRYRMKASPVRAGDHLDLLAEIDLLALLSACPGGDCGSGHSSDDARCFPLALEVWTPAPGALDGREPPSRSPYAGGHGLRAAGPQASRASAP